VVEPVLVSACLLGQPVRYHGGSAECRDPILQRWLAEGRVIAVCPEMAGGLPAPRPAAEIRPSQDGVRVLRAGARVIDAAGADVTSAFARGAEQTLAIARARRVQIAVLKEGSPSCGSGYVYDGSFSGTRAPGMGVTAACLAEAGVRVFSESQLVQAALYLEELETQNTHP
jgi:uncharacterized protein YbbK (DUF523 family)